MVWVRIDDHFDEHPKIATLDDHAFALFVSGLAYCNRNMTDGFIPTPVGLGKLRWCDGKSKKVAAALEQAGLWIPVEGGWTVHDYDDYQPTKEQIEAERAKKQAAGQAGGQASAQARASANGRTRGQAKFKPVPGPVSGPINPDRNSLPAANAAGPSHQPPEFSEGERSEIDEIETTLEPFGLHQRPEFWRKVLDTYGELPLGMEALKQADWLRRNNKRIVNVSRYTNWLDKAMVDYRDHAPPALVEVPRRPPHFCTVECEHECFDLECAIHGDATRESIQRRIASHAKGALSA